MSERTDNACEKCGQTFYPHQCFPVVTDAMPNPTIHVRVAMSEHDDPTRAVPEEPKEDDRE